MSDTVKFRNLLFEMPAPREQMYKHSPKRQYAFQDSQQRITGLDLERHPTSAELYALVCAYLDDLKRAEDDHLLNAEQEALARDMLDSTGEWSCQTFRIVARGLFGRRVYINFNEPGNVMRGFDISDLYSGNNYLKNIFERHDDLIRHLYSRSFRELPEKFRDLAYLYIEFPGSEYRIIVEPATGTYRNPLIESSSNWYVRTASSRGVKTYKGPPQPVAVSIDEAAENV